MEVIAAAAQQSHLLTSMRDAAAELGSVGEIGGSRASPTESSPHADSWLNAGNPQASHFVIGLAGLAAEAERSAGAAAPPGTSGLQHSRLPIQVRHAPYHP